ncbi:MAG: gliding motility-associated C-terminal domain-containing protein [Cyclobacteriaceae bacterium]|nr:gliding motility-associated C-terminal domain-containing protein [Cyclobacteriaceae bacterium]
MKKVYLRVFVLIFLGFSVSGWAQAPALKFVENKNQWPTAVDFAARTPAGSLLLTPGKFSLYLLDQQKMNEAHMRLHGYINEADGTEPFEDKVDGHHVQLLFEGSSRSITPVASGRTREYYNFFLGNDSSTWASRAYGYTEVIYPELYTGIDLRVSSVNHNLKYDFIVKPDASASAVQVRVNGADQLYLDHGNLIIKTSVGYLIEKKPFTYQVINGEQCEVRSEYVLEDEVLSFRFPDGYDACYELVIDPLLIFSTFSGSTADNWGSTATPGERGTLYSSGIVNNSNFGGTGSLPATPGVFQTEYGGNYDIAILKYDSTGSSLLYASYLGGSDNETPHSLVMDEKTQDLLVLGTTSSFNFPTSLTAFGQSFNGGVNVGTNVISYNFGSDIILSRISKDGDQLKASTYLGGSHNDGLNLPGSALVRNYGDEMRGDIITDSLGNVYISSVTNSSDFPGINSFSTTYRGGGSDAVVVKMDPMLTQIIWSAFIGGNNVDASHTIKLDSAYAVYVGGGTASANFPVTPNAYQSTHAGGVDGWIMKLSSEGDSIAYATFTGTSGFDQVYFIDLDKEGDVYTYGQTNGNFPVTPGVYSNANSGQFVQKLNGTLSSLIFSTRFGSSIGIPNISPTAFLVNECNNLYMSGWGGLINSGLGYWNSSTVGMPITNDALQKTTSGSDFYFMVLTADASELLYATYLGGNISRTHVDGGTSRFDKSGIVYHAVCAGCRSLSATGLPSSDFPTTPGAWSQTNNSANCNNAAFKFDLSSLRARLQTNSVAFDQPGLNVICYPDTIRFQNFSTGGEFYEWDLGDGTTLVKTDTTSFLHQYQQEGTYVVKLLAIDLNTCIGIDSAFTTLRVFRNLLKAQEDDVICYGTTYTLNAESGGVSYQWSTGEGPLSSPIVQPEESTRYYVLITDANGCKRKDTVDIEVVPFIDVKFEYSLLVNDCYSRTQVRLRNLTEQRADEYYFMDFGDGFTTDQTDYTNAYEQDGTYTVKVAGVKEFCVYEKPVNVPVYTLLVPNIITPEDSPGQNDVFTIQYGSKGQTPADAGLTVAVTIHNRWGTKVFESANYQYNWFAKDLDAGIYYYTVTVADQVTCKSWVQVVK